MKIGILHLTDAHFSSDKDFVYNKTSKIVAAVKYIYEDCDKIYITFSGDIANMGKTEEYEIAKCFLNWQLYTILHNKIRVQPLLLLLWLQIY